MKICILSNKGDNLNEGQRNVAAHFAAELGANNEVLHLNAKNALMSLTGWKTIFSFRPQIIHFFLRPSYSTFFASKMLQLFFRSKVVFSALQPPELAERRYPIRWCAPNTVFCLTEKTEKIFQRLGVHTRRMFFGIDMDKFRPATGKEKALLREKYGFDSEALIALHVGHLLPGRNLHHLVGGNENRDYEIVVVASPLFPPDEALVKRLESNDVHIIQEHIDNINEIYQLSDLYLFPTSSPYSCIDAPLSVFEAMAVNLPVVSTKFGVLASGFENITGLHFVESPEDIPRRASQVLSSDKISHTRASIMQYTWTQAAKKMEMDYREVVNEG